MKEGQTRQNEPFCPMLRSRPQARRGLPRFPHHPILDKTESRAFSSTFQSPNADAGGQVLGSALPARVWAGFARQARRVVASPKEAPCGTPQGLAPRRKEEIPFGLSPKRMPPPSKRLPNTGFPYTACRPRPDQASGPPWSRRQCRASTQLDICPHVALATGNRGRPLAGPEAHPRLRLMP